jgi:hypothetical protein
MMTWLEMVGLVCFVKGQTTNKTSMPYKMKHDFVVIIIGQHSFLVKRKDITGRTVEGIQQIPMRDFPNMDNKNKT